MKKFIQNYFYAIHKMCKTLYFFFYIRIISNKYFFKPIYSIFLSNPYIQANILLHLATHTISTFSMNNAKSIPESLPKLSILSFAISKSQRK